MAVTVRGTPVATSHASAGTFTPSAFTTGTVQDDVVLFVVSGNSNVAITSVTAGWTQIGSIVPASDNDAILALYVRRFQTGDSVPTLTWTGVNVGGTRLITLQGVPTGFDLSTFSTLGYFRTAGTASGTSHAVTNLTIPAGGGLGITILAQDASAPNADNYSIAGGWTEIAEQDASSDVITGIATQNFTTAGTASATWTSVNTDTSAVIALLVPHTLVVAGVYWGRWGRRTHMHTPPTPPAGTLLKYAPPSTAGWNTITVPSDTVKYNGPINVANSYVYNMPGGTRGQVKIRNTANALMIGGEIEVLNATGSNPSGGGARRAIEINGMVGGVAFLEGLRLTRGSLNTESEGDSIYVTACPTTDLYIQNCYLEATGQQTNDHGDCIQFYGAEGTDVVRKLYMDKISMVTDYQGGPMIWNGTARELHLNRCDWFYNEAAQITRSGGIAGGGLVQLWGGDAANTPPDVIIMTNCKVRSVRSNNIGMAIGSTPVTWHQAGHGTQITSYSALQAYQAGGGVAEAWHPNVNGGTSYAFTYEPNASLYCPKLSVGATYTSPGYE